jgi:acetyl-CoA acetyltransferase
VISLDEGVRRGSSVDTLAKLKTVFKPEGGAITAGNSSQISDGSAGLLMMTSQKAAELGLAPIARIHTAVLAGADPVIMLTAPIPATVKALKRSGLSVDEIGAFEVNEAFASVPLAWLKDLGADAKSHPQPQHVLAAVQGDADGGVDGPVGDLPVADLDHDRVDEHGHVHAIERASGPVLHLGHHGVGDP